MPRTYNYKHTYLLHSCVLDWLKSIIGFLLETKAFLSFQGKKVVITRTSLFQQFISCLFLPYTFHSTTMESQQLWCRLRKCIFWAIWLCYWINSFNFIPWIVHGFINRKSIKSRWLVMKLFLPTYQQTEKSIPHKY